MAGWYNDAMPPLALVHTVRPAAPGADPPMVIWLHGVGSNERSMAPLANRTDPRFVAICARSPIQVGPESFAWFHVSFGPKGPIIVYEEARDGWRLLADFAMDAAAVYGANPRRVFLAGFSQGGILALATLLTAPTRIAGALAMSSRLLPEVLPHATDLANIRGKPVCVVHGTDDDKLPIQWARTAKEQLEPYGVDLTYRELRMGHTVTPESAAIGLSWLARNAAPANDTNREETA
jgi:phospholipase/carboxylesterase